MVSALRAAGLYLSLPLPFFWEIMERLVVLKCFMPAPAVRCGLDSDLSGDLLARLAYLRLPAGEDARPKEGWTHLTDDPPPSVFLPSLSTGLCPFPSTPPQIIKNEWAGVGDPRHGSSPSRALGGGFLLCSSLLVLGLRDKPFAKGGVVEVVKRLAVNGKGSSTLRGSHRRHHRSRTLSYCVGTARLLVARDRVD